MKRSDNGSRLVVITILLLVISVNSGCLNDQDEYIENVRFSIDIDYSQVNEVNISQISEELMSLGYAVMENEVPPGFNLYYHVVVVNNQTATTNYININAWEENESKRASWSGRIALERDRFGPGDENEANAHVITICDRLANICNITLNWSYAIWSYTYYHGH